MNQTRWNLPISQFGQLKILLLKMVAGWNPLFLKSTSFTSPTFPIQPDFPQNQPAAITLNTSFPLTLDKNDWIAPWTHNNLGPLHTRAKRRDHEMVRAQKKVSEAVPTHLHNHVVWPWTLKCGVESYVTGSSTKCYFNRFLFIRVFTYDKN